MKTKLFRTKAELITIFIISISISMVFTPIAEHIYKTTNWEKISIEEISKKLNDYKEKTINSQEIDKENKQKDLE